LFFRDHDRAGGRALAAEIVNRVEAGGEGAKHSALRHAPAARQDGRWDAVDL